MTNEFLRTSNKRLRDLQAAQARSARLAAKADRRLEAAQQRHAVELDAAQSVETVAWQALLSIPGMTVATAAVLCSTTEASVQRWAARGRRAS